MIPWNGSDELSRRLYSLTGHFPNRPIRSLAYAVMGLVSLLGASIHAQHVEMPFIHSLADPADATHVAIESGGWFKNTRWDVGSRPGDGARVYIPAGITMTVNSTANKRFQSIRVDGTLKFQTNTSRSLHADTVVVGMGGKIIMGTASSPIQAGVTARLVIDDYNGGFEITDTNSPDYDPLTVGQGLLVMGELEIHGSPKTPYTTFATEPSAGDQTLYLDSLPADWDVGDTVLLAGTRPEADGDETRTITAINASSNSVTIDSPLTYDHHTPTTSLPAGSLKVHIANLTRSAVIETVASNRGPTATITTSYTDNQYRETPGDQFWGRGHIMCMNNNFDIRYAALEGLGRTNKLIAAEDSVIDGGTVTSVGRNQRARYSFHAHIAGVTSSPGHIEGCSIVGAPGWGVVNHSSYVDVINNVSYDTAGGGFVSEAGNEVGSFIGNLAIRNHGDQVAENGRGDLDDWGHKGSGFWFQGVPGLIIRDNIASGSNGDAFAVYADPIGPTDTISTAYLKHPGNYFKAEEKINQIAGNTIEDNIVYGSHTGFAFFTSKSEDQLDQTVVENCTGWSVMLGTLGFYTAGYHYKNLVLVNDLDNPRGMAVDSHHGTYNVIYDDPYIEGFAIGLQVPRVARSNAINNGYFNNLVNIWIDPGRFLSTELGSDIRATELHILEPQFGTLSASAVTNGISNYEEARLLNTSNGEGDRHQNLGLTAQYDIFTDYHIAPSPPHQNNIFVPIYFTLDLGSEGCYRVYSEAHQKPDAVLFTSAIMNAAGGGADKNSKIPVQLWDMTNADIAATYTNNLSILATMDADEEAATYADLFEGRYSTKIATDPDWILAPGGRLLPSDYLTNSDYVDPGDANTLADGNHLRLLQTVLESVDAPQLEVAVGGQTNPASIDFGTITPGQPGTTRVDLSNLGNAPLDLWLMPLSGNGGIGVALPEETTGFFGPHASLWKNETGYLELEWQDFSPGSHNTTLEFRTTDPSQPVYTLQLTGTVPNVAPSTSDDEFLLTQDAEVELPVLDNDSDPNGETLTILSYSNPSHGVAYIDPDGQTIHYRPTAASWVEETLTYTVMDGAGEQSTATITLKAPFLETGGVVAIEGEHYGFIYPGTTYPNHTWTETTGVVDSSGGAAMASSDLGDQPKTGGPSLDFPISITTAGTYYVWARISSPNGNDSHGLLVGMDGITLTNGGSGLSNTSSSWQWDNSTNKTSQLSVTFPEAGVYTLNTWMNKDGVRLDALYLTTDAAAVPSGQLSSETERGLE